jgi:hypothetical protein
MLFVVQQLLYDSTKAFNKVKLRELVTTYYALPPLTASKKEKFFSAVFGRLTWKLGFFVEDISTCK